MATRASTIAHICPCETTGWMGGKDGTLVLLLGLQPREVRARCARLQWTGRCMLTRHSQQGCKYTRHDCRGPHGTGNQPAAAAAAVAAAAAAAALHGEWALDLFF